MHSVPHSGTLHSTTPGPRQKSNHLCILPSTSSPSLNSFFLGPAGVGPAPGPVPQARPRPSSLKLTQGSSASAAAPRPPRALAIDGHGPTCSLDLHSLRLSTAPVSKSNSSLTSWPAESCRLPHFPRGGMVCIWGPVGPSRSSVAIGSPCCSASCSSCSGGRARGRQRYGQR